MLQIQSRKAKFVALLTGGVLMAGALSTTGTAAQADTSKEKLYKGGAVALGVLGGYMILKGKTLPGAVAAAGAYYAYKKGQKEDDRYSSRDVYPDSRYSTNGRYSTNPTIVNKNSDNVYNNNVYSGRVSNSGYPEYNAPDYGYNGVAATPGANSTVVLK